MQCYAMSRELIARYPNHQVEVIDFEYLKKHNNYRAELTRFPFCVEYYFQYRGFQKDLAKLPLSDKTFIVDNTDELCDYIGKNYDIVIVGSDAVWTYQNRMPVDNPYFLFGDRLNNIIKMSYAASAFSTNFDKISTEERRIIKHRLSQFYYIGVRDEATKKFIESLHTGKKVYLNHDPTFFLQPATDAKLAKSTLHKNSVFNKKEKISFMTRELPQINDVRRELAGNYNLLHFYRRDKYKADLLDSRCRFMNNVSPLEWYNLYANMSLNITNFFHGACLGIINHIPTIVVDDFDKNYRSKYAQLMIDLDLTDRLFYKKEFDYKRFINTVRYCLSHQEEEAKRLIEAIAIERQKSTSFFEALDNILQ